VTTRTTIAAILRGMSVTPPSDMSREIARHKPSEQKDDAELTALDFKSGKGPEQNLPPVSPRSPWLSYDIRASTSRDVLAAIERGRDPRSFAQRQADGAKSQAVQKARPPVFTFSASGKRGWGERSAGQTLRDREAVRLRAQAKRARKKAEAGERATP
jgi:hypothetical protein